MVLNNKHFINTDCSLH